MADSFKKLRDLDLSRDEVNRIGEALSNEEFRKLFVEYVEEVQNPESKKQYLQEIAQLERERGNDVTFIEPTPGYVIKTTVGGKQKCFINVCSNDKIQKPSTTVPQEGKKGVCCSIPYSTSASRQDVDQKGQRCQVFDVVFHPDALQGAQTSKPFRDLLNSTACDAIEKNLGAELDRVNLKFPKLKYKGTPNTTMMRKPSADTSEVVEREGPEKEFFDQIYAKADESAQTPKPPQPRSPKKHRREEGRSSYTNPKYTITHRNHVDMQEFIMDKNAKLNATIPKELVVEVFLPLLKCASDITLNMTEKTVEILSEKPSKYKLNLTLPYSVNEAHGTAKFDKEIKKLVITLPVKRSNVTLCDFGKEDSGVESDHGSPISPVFHENIEQQISSVINSVVKANENAICSRTTSPSKFLDESVCYNLPEFTCHLFENILAFTLNVKNVDEKSVASKVICSDTNPSVHIKFTSVSSSFYPVSYAFYIKLDAQSISSDNVSVETWDNNVVVQVPFEPSHVAPKFYLCGLDEHDLKKTYLEEPSVLNTVLENGAEGEANRQPATANSLKKGDESEKENVTLKSSAISIGSSADESSWDELSSSCSSFSPSKGRGILKRLSSQRFFAVRSISESSLDDYAWPSSVEMGSSIPENCEATSSSLKKTVRFSDVIKRQLYRSNSSILGQKKKNQRKSRNKKRASDRRYSESEASEADDKKDEEEESPEVDIAKLKSAFRASNSSYKKGETNVGIFEMDLN